MTKLYFYPKIILKSSDVQNSYINDFENAIAVHHEVVNKEANSKGVVDFFKYISKTDIFLFNWIEDIPRRKMGKLQVLFFVLFLSLVKIRKKKIIWILHNKYSHNLAKNRWTDFMFKTMMKNSNLILTHSNEGIEFAKKKFPKDAHKIKYEIHPIKSKIASTPSSKKYDFLFWGSIHPYKDIVKFLEFIKAQKVIDSPKILIIGRCFDEDYKKLLQATLNEDMIFEDKFYDMEDIAQFASESKYILFTYNAGSVLSSGALMDSLRMNSQIIGPNHGAFKDLSHLSTVHVFDEYKDILSIYKCDSDDQESVKQELDDFFEENSWLRFADKIQIHTNSLLLEK